MAVRDVTDLNVYKRALNILPRLYKLVSQLPKQFFNLKNQIISSGQSIPPILAEGFGRKSARKDFLHFVRMALGSSDETITHAREIYMLSKQFSTIDQKLCVEIGTEYKIISKQLNKLIGSWK